MEIVTIIIKEPPTEVGGYGLAYAMILKIALAGDQPLAENKARYFVSPREIWRSQKKAKEQE